MHTNPYYAALSLIALLMTSFSAAASTTPNKPICYKHTDPMKPNRKFPVPCGETVTQTSPSASSLLEYSVTDSGKFELIFSCIPPNGPSCVKAQDTFQQAFSILESYLILKTNIVVNASFLNFCTARGQCGSDGFQILGGAAPANSMEIQDSDGVSRMYPQALLKQLDIKSHPRFEPEDIFCEFNAAADFHFPSDKTPMKSTQADMLFVVLHELIHGLGFTSAWDDYVNTQAQALTPGITGATDNSGQFKFRGFVENVFDKFIFETATGNPMSARTTALNSIFEYPATTFQSQQAFFSALQTSQAANTLTVGALKLATTANSLSFRAANGQTMMLETSLSPYATGSSVSHANLKTFTNTADFLMRFRVDSGASLESAGKIGGGGPLGPILLSVLQTLGYATVDNPKPVIPSSLSSNSFPSLIPNSNLALYAFIIASVAYSCSPYFQ